MKSEIPISLFPPFTSFSDFCSLGGKTHHEEREKNVDVLIKRSERNFDFSEGKSERFVIILFHGAIIIPPPFSLRYTNTHTHTRTVADTLNSTQVVLHAHKYANMVFRSSSSTGTHMSHRYK